MPNPVYNAAVQSRIYTDANAKDTKIIAHSDEYQVGVEYGAVAGVSSTSKREVALASQASSYRVGQTPTHQFGNCAS